MLLAVIYKINNFEGDLTIPTHDYDNHQTEDVEPQISNIQINSEPEKKEVAEEVVKEKKERKKEEPKNKWWLDVSAVEEKRFNTSRIDKG